MVAFWSDPRMLAEGNARGIPGGDPDFPAHRHLSGGIAGGSPDDFRPRGTVPAPYVPNLQHLSGDLNQHASQLGIPVEDLVRARLTARPTGGRLLDLIRAAYERWSRR